IGPNDRIRDARSRRKKAHNFFSWPLPRTPRTGYSCGRENGAWGLENPFLDQGSGRSVTSVHTVAECTVPEKILLAASQLGKDGQTTFTAEALIVTSWQKFPKTFGLKGYDELYPDSNKILSSIMGEKELARRGWLVKMGQKLYALTREGRQVVRRLLHE